MANDGYREIPSASPNQGQTAHDCVPLPHPARQIRVLDLDPDCSSSQDMNKTLKGSLRVISLPTDQNYSALSWVWSQKDPGTSKRQNRLIIHCDGCGHQHNAQIRPNLWSALWHISQMREFLTVWADAICIDQRHAEGKDGNEEMMHQIPLMRSIYASAHTTYFWLGEASKGTDEAMEYLRNSKLSISSDTMIDKWRATFELYVYSATFSMPPHQAGLEDIFTRPWIERLWTLQECLLSRKGIVVCGKKSIAWPDLICALESIHWFHTKSTTFCSDLPYQPWLNLANLSRWFADSDGVEPSRDQLLHQAPEGFDSLGSRIQGQLQCLEYADKIFGLLVTVSTLIIFALRIISALFHGFLGKYASLMDGVACYAALFVRSTYSWNPKRKFKFIPPSTHHSIVQEIQNRKVSNPKDIYYGTVGILGHSFSDAEESLYTLHRRLCTNLIDRTKSLDVLLLVNSFPGNERSPSWVINWKLKTPRVWGKALHFRPYLLHVELLERCGPSSESLWWRWLVYTKDQYSHRFETMIDPFRLFNKVKVVRATAKYPGATPGTPPLYRIRNNGKILCVHAVELTRVSSTFNLADGTRGLARVLSDALSSMDESGQLRARAFLKEFMVVSAEYPMLPEAFDRWWLKLRTSLGAPRGRDWIERWMATDRIFRSSDNMIRDILRDEGLSVVCCQANDMSSGGPAFAPIGAQKDDTVVVVSGLSFPLVLRHKGQQRFRLIGPLSLPGVMWGDLKDALTPEAFHEIELV